MPALSHLQVSNIDIFLAGIAIAGIAILGFAVYNDKPQSATARTFLWLSIATIAWSLFNISIFYIADPTIALWVLRASIFFALWHAYFLFRFFYVFPRESSGSSSRVYAMLTTLTLGVSGLIFTPLVFSEVTSTYGGHIQSVDNGVGIYLFGVFLVGYILSGILIFAQKTFQAEPQERSQYLYVLIGSLITFSLLIVFNFVYPAFLSRPALVQFAPLFTLPFIGFTAYAIIQYNLLNIKIIATELLAFGLAIASLFQITFADTPAGIAFNIATFVVVLGFSIWLIQSVRREVEQRQRIEELAGDLRKANARLKELDTQKSEFLSIASHQLRSPLTAMKGYASMVLEGEYGKIPKKVEGAVQKIYDASENMHELVEDFLNVSRIEQGRMEYNTEELDLVALAADITEQEQPAAEEAGLELTFHRKAERCTVRADDNKMRQIVRNLIDNAIKYTKDGSITATARCEAEEAVVSVSDTGVGMSQETLDKLFRKFSRADNANEVNVSGTGLGLYIARQMLEEQGGTIEAQSPGEGQGSTFTIRMPRA